MSNWLIDKFNNLGDWVKNSRYFRYGSEYLDKYLDRYSAHLRLFHLLTGIGILGTFTYLIYYRYSRGNVPDINNDYSWRSRLEKTRLYRYKNETDGPISGKYSSEYPCRFKNKSMDEDIEVDKQNMDLLDRILYHCELLLSNRDPAPLRFYWHDESNILCKGISRKDREGKASSRRIEEMELHRGKVTNINIKHDDYRFELDVKQNNYELVCRGSLDNRNQLLSALAQLSWIRNVYVILTKDKKKKDPKDSKDKKKDSKDKKKDSKDKKKDSKDKKKKDPKVPERIISYLDKLGTIFMGDLKRISPRDGRDIADERWGEFIHFETLESLPIDDPEVLNTGIRIYLDKFLRSDSSRSTGNYTLHYEDAVLIRRCIEWLGSTDIDSILDIDLLHWSEDGVLSKGPGKGKLCRKSTLEAIKGFKADLPECRESILGLVPVDDGKPRGDHGLEYRGRSKGNRNDIIKDLGIFERWFDKVIDLYLFFKDQPSIIMMRDDVRKVMKRYRSRLMDVSESEEAETTMSSNLPSPRPHMVPDLPEQQIVPISTNNTEEYKTKQNLVIANDTGSTFDNGNDESVIDSNYQGKRVRFYFGAPDQEMEGSDIRIDMEYQYIYLLMRLVDWCKGILAGKDDTDNPLPIYHWDDKRMLREGSTSEYGNGMDKFLKEIRTELSSQVDYLVGYREYDKISSDEYKFKLHLYNSKGDHVSEDLNIFKGQVTILHRLWDALFSGIYVDMQNMSSILNSWIFEVMEDYEKRSIDDRKGGAFVPANNNEGLRDIVDLRFVRPDGGTHHGGYRLEYQYVYLLERLIDWCAFKTSKEVPNKDNIVPRPMFVWRGPNWNDAVLCMGSDEHRDIIDKALDQNIPKLSRYDRFLIRIRHRGKYYELYYDGADITEEDISTFTIQLSILMHLMTILCLKVSDGSHFSSIRSLLKYDVGSVMDIYLRDIYSNEGNVHYIDTGTYGWGIPVRYHPKVDQPEIKGNDSEVIADRIIQDIIDTCWSMTSRGTLTSNAPHDLLEVTSTSEIDDAVSIMRAMDSTDDEKGNESSPVNSGITIDSNGKLNSSLPRTLRSTFDNDGNAVFMDEHNNIIDPSSRTLVDDTDGNGRGISGIDNDYSVGNDTDSD